MFVFLCTKITWLEGTKPCSDNKSMVYAAMEETREYRRQFIDKDKPSITEVLKMFPRFLDVDDGALVSIFRVRFMVITCCWGWS